MKTKKQTHEGTKMKSFRIFLAVILLLTFFSTVSGDGWVGETDSSNNRVFGSPTPSKSFGYSSSSQAWSWSTSGALLAYGYGNASTSTTFQNGDNCYALAQILLLKNGSVIAYSTTANVFSSIDPSEPGNGYYVYASKSHTFNTDNYTGPVDEMSVKIRTYVWGCFMTSAITWYDERVYPYFEPAPLNPTSLTASSNSGYAHISWSGGAGAEKFVIEWDGGVYGWEQIAEINASSKSYTDYSIPTSPQVKIHKYRVKSVNWWNSNRQESSYSNTAQIWGAGMD